MSAVPPEQRPTGDGRPDPGTAGARSPEPGPAGGSAELDPQDWPLWEVFVRPRRGMSHLHAGSLHAADARMALHQARDVYTRRGEGSSIWVVPSAQITASSPDERDTFFDPAADKIYRHPTFYPVPDGVENL